MTDLRPKKFSVVKYITSASSPKSLPLLLHKEIMFVGRSNAGKSSLINAILNCKIAKTSRSPGRTQQVNFFQIHSNDCFVDCPGYGFASVSKSLKNKWPDLIKACMNRPNLVGIVWIMDIRHPLQAADIEAWKTIANARCNVHVVLNKSDKVNLKTRSKSMRILEEFFAALDVKTNVSLQDISTTSKRGLLKLDNVLLSWLDE
jgi:GTP-binding protein